MPTTHTQLIHCTHSLRLSVHLGWKSFAPFGAVQTLTFPFILRPDTEQWMNEWVWSLENAKNPKNNQTTTTTTNNNNTHTHMNNINVHHQHHQSNTEMMKGGISPNNTRSSSKNNNSKSSHNNYEGDPRLCLSSNQVLKNVHSVD
jgi:hypothetical protein